jgi:hypothetical protein
MKIWFNNFLQNAAFPAVVLAFACAPLNNKVPDLKASQLTDRRGVVNSAKLLYRSNEQGNKVGAGAQSYIQPGSQDRASEHIHMPDAFKANTTHQAGNKS